MKNVLMLTALLMTSGLMAQEVTCVHLVADSTEMMAVENVAQLQLASFEEYSIPVVFHVIHKGEPYGVESNVTDEQVISAVDNLNEWFSDPGTPWTGFTFCLASTDPEGNATNGIMRVDGTDPDNYTLLSSALAIETASKFAECGMRIYDQNAAVELNVKNLSRWSNQEYFNVWLVPEIDCNNGGSGIQGFAYFPTLSPVDGVVQLYNATGTVGTLKSYTNLNKTFVHEVGHYFALFHTFQGASCAEEANCNIAGDRVCDTPPQTQAASCTFGACGGYVSENHMDYLNQNCRIKFTQGQVNRMRQVGAVSRAALLAQGTCLDDCSATMPSGLSHEYTDAGLAFSWTSDAPECRMQGEYILNGKRKNFDVSGNTALVPHDQIPASGNYRWRVICECNGELTPWSAWEVLEYTPPISAGMYTGPGEVFDLIGNKVTGRLGAGVYIVRENGFTHKIAIE